MIEKAMSETAIVSIDSIGTDYNMTATATTTTQRRSSPSPYNPMAILWDIENTPVPSDVRPEDVAGNIRMAIQLHPVVTGAAVVNFSAFGDFNAFPRRVREGLQRTGVKLVDVPNGRKDAADKAILLDMFLFALDHPPPSTIVLITGDVDFAPALHVLGQRGYNVVLIIPSGVYVNPALTSAGKFVWDWHSVVHGEGFVPLPRPLPPPRPYLMGCGFNGGSSSSNLDGMNEDETILYRGVSQQTQSCYGMVSSQFQNECSGGVMSCWPSNTGESSAYPPPGHLETTMWVAPGDFNGLKGQLVKLLELSGGCMPLTRITSEYQRNFSKPLFVTDYGSPKLVDLFKKMSDVIAVVRKGNKRFVYLRNSKPNLVSPSPPVVLLRREDKGKAINEGVTVDSGGRGASSDELSDTGSGSGSGSGSVQSERSLEEFKLELQDILVSYGCRVQMGYFEAIYKQRYKRPLDYKKMGVDQLDQLIDKFTDVVAIYEDPATGTTLIDAL